MVWKMACISFLLSLSTQVKASSEEKPAAPTKQKQEAGRLHEMRGVVQEVNRNRNQLILASQEGPPVLLQMDKSTTIFIDGRAGSVDDIKNGAEIRAAYELSQNENRAQWIEVTKNETKKPDQSKEKLPDMPRGNNPSAPDGPLTPR